jgi:hypothetical protein
MPVAAGDKYDQIGVVRRHAFSGGMLRKVVMGVENAKRRLLAGDYVDEDEKQHLEGTVKLGEEAHRRDNGRSGPMITPVRLICWLGLDDCACTHSMHRLITTGPTNTKNKEILGWSR